MALDTTKRVLDVRTAVEIELDNPDILDADVDGLFTFENDLTDESTNGNDLTANGTQVYVPSRNGYGLLDSTAALFAYEPEAAKFDYGTPDFSIEALIRLHSDAAWGTGRVASKYDTTAGATPKGSVPGWMLYVGSVTGTSPVLFLMHDGTDLAFVQSTTNFRDGVPHVVAVTADRDGNLLLYIDGVLEDTASLAAIDDITNGKSMRVQHEATGVEIDELRFSSKVRTPTEVLNYYHAQYKRKLYLSDRGFSSTEAGEERYYHPRARVQPIHTAMQSRTEAKERQVMATVNLNNRDGAVSDLLRLYRWENRPITIKCGEGRDVSAYSTDFAGRIPLNGISFTEKMVTVKAQDRRGAERKDLPQETFPATATAVAGQPIPICLGNFTGESGQPMPVPCACATKHDGGTGSVWKICQGPIVSIATVFVNGVATTHNSPSTTGAKFLLPHWGAIPTPRDVSAIIQGYHSGTPTTVPENPVGQLKILMEDFLSIPATASDATTWAALSTTAAMATLKSRIFIRDPKNSSELIAGLLNEIDCDRWIDENGKYTIGRRAATATMLSLGTTDILDGSYSGKRDWGGDFTNKILAEYNWNPVSETYDDMYVGQNTASQGDYLQTVQRNETYDWLYDDDDVEWRVDLEITNFKDVTEQVTVTAEHRGFLVNVGDSVDLTFDRFSNEVFQVRGVKKDYQRLRNTLTLE